MGPGPSDEESPAVGSGSSGGPHQGPTTDSRWLTTDGCPTEGKAARLTEPGPWDPG